MKINKPNYVPKPKTPKRLNPSIRMDLIDPSDFIKYNFTHSCEHCSHFNNVDENCTLNYYSKHHRLENNLKSYDLSGRMALCRFLEID
jgi:hypothetical protein